MAKHRKQPPWRQRTKIAVGIAAPVLAGILVWTPNASPDTATSPVERDARALVTGVADLPTVPVSPGTAVAVPAVGLDVSLEPMRFEGSVLDPPADVARAGLWVDGAGLAKDGNQPTVIAGHVSDGRDRPGAFRHLWDVRPGMIATTRDAAGALRSWRVVEVRRFHKDQLPRAVFLPGSGRKLRLITCAERVESGGRFHYTDNLVVDLVPVANINGAAS